jgi:hypothetical protein
VAGVLPGPSLSYGLGWDEGMLMFEMKSRDDNSTVPQGLAYMLAILGMWVE